ncbi:M28 family peptidase [Massilia sp. GCM10023247]|uniref:M28 family peptidase n=1 Tax=Massilia sp. GCM10023247 TaxID=3252643 RepID=UPI00361C1433
MSADSPLTTPIGRRGLAASLVLVALLGYLALRPARPPLPPAAPLDASLSQFSAARAARHVEALARAPRPIASDANREARAYLVRQLRAIGLEPEVQQALVQKNYVDYNANYQATLAVVHNVLVRLPGTAPAQQRRPALLLAAHYDSAPASLAAAGGAAPVAALLETLRALRAAGAGTPPANDVLVLFADGERVGSLGMQAFVEQHPWAREVGLALRFDGAGSGGPLELVGAQGANRSVVDGWLRATPDVSGSSLMHEVYRLVPRPLHPGALARLDAPVLQFANRGRPFDRAQALDVPARLEHPTLQHMGSAMLRLARHFGAAQLEPRAAHGQVMFALPLAGTVQYGGELAWVFTSLACLLLAGVLWSARRRARVDYPQLVAACFIVPSIAVALGVLAWQLWMQGPALHRAWNPAAPTHDRYALLYLGAIAALCTGLFIAAQRALQRLTGTAAAMLGALVGLTLVLLAASWLAPGASYLIVWPLLAALASYAGLHARRVAAWPPAARLAALLLGVLPAVLLVPPALRDTFMALSPLRMNLPVAMLALLLGVSTLLLARARRYTARALVLAGLGGLALAGSADEFTEAPLARANGLVYYKDMPSWDAYWLHPAGPLDPWERKLFSNLKQPHVFVNVFGWESPRQWYAWAPRDGLEFPFVRILRSGKAPNRHADFTLVSKNRAPQIRMEVKYARPVRVTVNGRVLLDVEAKTLSIVLYGMEDTLLHFRIDVLSDPIFAVKIEEVLPGLPERLLPPRPAGTPPLIPLSAKSVSSDTLWFY